MRNKSGDLCQPHYSRVRRTGDVGTLPIADPKAPNPPCEIEGCERPYYGRGWCQMHWARWNRTGDPLLVRDQKRENNPNWHGDSLTYSGAHQRVRYVRGSARDYQCVACGQNANEWAVIRTDSTRQAFSTDPDDYQPMCFSCHRIYDTNWTGYAPDVVARWSAIQSELVEPSHPERRKTHCPYGHPYDAENTHVTKAGVRHCRACDRRRKQESRARSRGITSPE